MEEEKVKAANEYLANLQTQAQALQCHRRPVQSLAASEAWLSELKEKGEQAKQQVKDAEHIRKEQQKAKRRARYRENVEKKRPAYEHGDTSTSDHCDYNGDDYIERTKHLSAEYDNLMDYLKTALHNVPPPAVREPEPTYLESSRSDWNEVFASCRLYFKTGFNYKKLPLKDRMDMLLQRKEYKCPLCKGRNIDLCERSMPIRYLSVNGMSDEKLRVPKCLDCQATGIRIWNNPVQYMQVALWPLTVHSWTFIDFGLMSLLSNIQHCIPNASYSGLLEALKFNDKFPTIKSFSLRQDVFNQTMFEWRRQEFQMQSDVVGSLFTCPSCQDTPHAVHMDGNAKLYRYKNRATQNCLERILHPEPEDRNPFFVDERVVEATVQQVRPINVTVTKTCGDTTWKAVDTVGKAFAKKSVTGCMLATCRHSLLLRGLDMHRGEIYAYPYCLQQGFPGARYIAMDTMCKYWPWLNRVDQQMAKSQLPFLSVMHAKAHNWKCQMTWSGRVIDGAGLSTGETTEQANSYLSRLGSTTRHMTSWGRRERIQQGSAFWNIRKMLDQARLLWTTYDKCIKSLAPLEDRVSEACEGLKLTVTQVLEKGARVTQLGTGDKTSEQSKMEDLACTIQRNRYLVKQSSGSTSKLRAKYLRKLREAMGRMAECQKLYREKHPNLGKDAFKYAVDTMIFPWTADSCGVRLTAELIEAIHLANLLNRSREEKLILETERNQLLSFWNKQWQERRSSSQMRLVFLEGMMSQCRYYFGGYCTMTDDTEDVDMDVDVDKDGSESSESSSSEDEA